MLVEHQSVTLAHCASCVEQLPLSRPKLDYASDFSVMSLLSVSNIEQPCAPPHRLLPVDFSFAENSFYACGNSTFRHIDNLLCATD